MENNWQIADQNGLIHEGNDDQMTAAFEYMTTPIETLIENYPDLDPADLYESVKKWESPFSGELKLIEIHASYKKS